MKAVRVHSYGGPETLVYEDAPLPELGAGDVLVRVQAAGVNPVDKVIRLGYLQGLANYTLPLTLGQDVAGIVEQVGPEVTGLAVGDTVYGFASVMRPGTYAEFAVLPADQLAPRPASLDPITAAGVPLAATTAWQCLAAAGVAPGQTVLVQAAGGGVGSFAVQIAKAQGLHVIATAAPDKTALARELGADEVVDYTAGPLEQAVSGVDAVLDTVGGATAQRAWAVLKPGGVQVSVVEQQLAAPDGVRFVPVFASANRRDLDALSALIDSGQVKVVMGSVYPLAEAQAAHAALDGGHLRGKIVLRVE